MSALIPLRFPMLVLLALASSSLGFTRLAAEVTVPSIIGDNMMLQADKPAPLWGRARPGEVIRINFADQTLQTTANDAGAWAVTLAPMAANPESRTLTITGDNELVMENVIVGEVWLCSGQSNMGFQVKRADDAAAEIAAAEFPSIRLFTVKREVATDGPRWDCEGRWVECSPATVGSFSAVAYFAGRDLHQKLQRPVGLIHSSWGGTKAKVWIPRTAIESRPELNLIAEAWERELADYPRAKAEFEARLPQLQAEWEKRAASAAAEGRAAPATPKLRTGPDSQYVPTALYNAMIAPLAPYGLRGFVWYQGESDVGAPGLYAETLHALVQSWRVAWAQTALPFVCVQLPNLERQPEPTRSGWPELREAQRRIGELPQTALVVTIDVGDPADIHPTHKQPVGRRVALAAMALAYGEAPASALAPLPNKVTIEGSQLRIDFQNVAGELKTADAQAPRGFVIAGDDRVFRPAVARVAGDQVIVSHPDLVRPVAVRYAWADNPDCNLVDEAGLPVTPFRTDDWTTLHAVMTELGP